MNATKEKPLVLDHCFGYKVCYWPTEHVELSLKNDEPYAVEFKVYNESFYPQDLYACEFSIKWDGCVNLSSNPECAMHFCSHEGVRRFTAVLLKCFELAATLMPSRSEEFLTDRYYDEPDVLAAFAGLKTSERSGVP